MSRTPPQRTPEQQRDADRVQALRSGTPEAMRAWAATYQVPLFHQDDDDLLLVAIHDARATLFTGQLRRESLAWLAAHQERILAERRAQRGVTDQAA